MRKHLQQLMKLGEVVYVFTTHGYVHIGRIEAIEGDDVVLRGHDGHVDTHVNIVDISGARLYRDEPEWSDA